MYVSGITSLEIHEGTRRLFTVYTHGDTHLRLHADRVDVAGAERVIHADPRSGHGERYSEVVFPEPREVEVRNEKIGGGGGR